MAAIHVTDEAGVRLLPLTAKRNGHNGFIIGHTKVLDDEFTKTTLAHRRWNLGNNGYPLTCFRKHEGYGHFLLHHLVYAHYFGEVPKGFEIDHRDRDKLNNLPSNLRAVTSGLNKANSGMRQHNTSGYQCVSFCKDRGKWDARIKVRGVQICLGRYPKPEDAARAVNDAYRKHYPEIEIPNPQVE